MNSWLSTSLSTHCHWARWRTPLHQQSCLTTTFTTALNSMTIFPTVKQINCNEDMVKWVMCCVYCGKHKAIQQCPATHLHMQMMQQQNCQCWHSLESSQRRLIHSALHSLKAIQIPDVGYISGSKCDIDWVLSDIIVQLCVYCFYLF